MIRRLASICETAREMSSLRRYAKNGVQSPVVPRLPGPGAYWSPRHRMPFHSGDEGSTCVSMPDVANKGPGRYCWPRDRHAFNSRDEGSKCVSMTWRATSTRPYKLPAAHLVTKQTPVGRLEGGSLRTSTRTEIGRARVTSGWMQVQTMPALRKI